MDEDRRSGEDGRSDVLNPDDGGRERLSEVPAERLPRSMRRRLNRCADAWISECGATGDASGRGAWRRGRSGLIPALLPWCFAGAFALLALAGWWPRLAVFEGQAIGSFDQWRAGIARERMLHRSTGIGHWRWSRDVSTVDGDVVWDPERQEGFLKLKGFVANDPARSQYQLWIFDAARDERYPVDGGVFDVPGDREEVLVPIKAAVPVSRPSAFAVTVEKSGGAVVSRREKVVALAHASG